MFVPPPPSSQAPRIADLAVTSLIQPSYSMRNVLTIQAYRPIKQAGLVVLTAVFTACTVIIKTINLQEIVDLLKNKHFKSCIRPLKSSDEAFVRRLLLRSNTFLKTAIKIIDFLFLVKTCIILFPYACLLYTSRCV